MRVNACPGAPGVVRGAELKVRRAAQDFEGELLSCLLGPMERAFSGVGQDGAAAGSDQYGYLGIQALAAALARSGGIGMSTLVLAQIERTKVRGADPGTGPDAAPQGFSK